MNIDQVRTFLKEAPEEYARMFEEKHHHIVKKVFMDACSIMANFVDNDGEYQFKWEDETFRDLKIRNDIDNAAHTPMTLNGYQKAAMKTCMPSCENFSYMMLNLVGEVGELASKVAKDIRKGNVIIDSGKAYSSELLPEMLFDEWVERQEEYMKEAGDILWQLSGVCSVMGWTLEDVAKGNLEKLASRKERGVIDGNGDNR